MVAYLQKSEGSEGFHQIIDFLTTSHISTLENEDMEISATIRWKVKETEVPQPSSLTQTHVANEAASTGVDVRHGGAATSVSSLDARQGSGNIDKTPCLCLDSLTHRVYTLGSDEGRIQHNELMDLVTKLLDKVVSLETDLQQTKKVYGDAYTKLIKKVKRWVHRLKGGMIMKWKLILSLPLLKMLVQLMYQLILLVQKLVLPVLKLETACVSVEYIQQVQERLGFKEAQRLQEQFDEEERQRIASVYEEASTFKPEEWDNIQAQIEVDEELAHSRMNVEALQTKYQFIDWEVYTKDSRSVLEDHQNKERELWVELKRLFEPVDDDELWKSQRYMYDPLTWRLYDTCGVHNVSTERGHDIFMLVEKDYPLTRGLMTLMLCNNSEVDQHSEMAVSVPLFPSPEPTVSCIDDLDFFKDSENEFSAIVYNDALTSKLDFSTKPTLCPQHIDEFNLKDETSISEYNKVEQNVLNFNDLFPFNIIYPYDLKSDKGNDDNEIDMIQSSGGQLVALLSGGGYTEDDSTTILSRGLRCYSDEDGIHWGRWAGGICKSRLEEIVWEPSTFSSGQFFSTCKIKDEMGLDVAGLHTAKEMVEDGFRACWLGSERLILDKGYLSDYWIEISSDRDFLRGAPSYTYIRDPVRRLCHRLISYNIYGKGQTPEKYLFRHAKGRMSNARLSGGHFDGRLAHHFGLVSDDGLRGLTVVACELPLIDMGELIKLNICKEIGDDWDWVASRPERQ
ncbi:hypothetical protein Tco_0954781 [Tanacetum coccineum]|uniref:Uncharacterized protein n=1 Tax=Tanacetum coccineum TaxID=301880 RepID=A0ABQ5E5C0_9ASTR